MDIMDIMMDVMVDILWNHYGHVVDVMMDIW